MESPVKMISVIIPVFNACDYLEKCINSVLNQDIDIDSYEIILVDDGSYDGSEELVESYKEINRFKIIHTLNKGVSHARNVGLRFAEGKYIAFIDADDFIKPDYLKELLLAAENNGAGIVESGHYIFMEDEKKAYEESLENIGIYENDEVLELLRESVGYSYDDMKKWLRYRNFTRGTVVWARLYRRDIIINNNIWFDENIRIAEDLIFNLGIYLKCHKVVRIGYIGYYYVRRKNSALQTYLTKNYDYLVENKRNLAIKRDEICNNISNKDKKEKIKSFYQGSLILSCGEIAVSLAQNKDCSYKEKVKKYNRYSNLLPVKNARKNLTLNGLSLKHWGALFLIKYNFSEALLAILMCMSFFENGISL